MFDPRPDFGRPDAGLLSALRPAPPAVPDPGASPTISVVIDATAVEAALRRVLGTLDAAGPIATPAEEDLRRGRVAALVRDGQITPQTAEVLARLDPADVPDPAPAPRAADAPGLTRAQLDQVCRYLAEQKRRGG